MLVCPSCGEPTRVNRAFLEDGQKVRLCKKCGEVIDKI
jgi:large subunit ribosomal protein L24